MVSSICAASSRVGARIRARLYRLAGGVAVGRHLDEQPLEDGDDERERLAGAGLRAGDDVEALEGQRDDRGLHLTGLLVAHVDAAGHQPRIEA